MKLRKPRPRDTNIKLIVGIYIAFTIIKLFTARMDFQCEEDPSIYFKIYPTINNIFYGGNSYIDFYSEKYSWYRSQEYFRILPLNGYYVLWYIYDAIIYLWWAMSAGLVVVVILWVLKISSGIKMV
ncbi:MAG: hypothetical protein FWE57_10985 [Chitinispirillia bacterium]|nr:hypothetical protein [Chitinispirillia bacterium]